MRSSSRHPLLGSGRRCREICGGPPVQDTDTTPRLLGALILAAAVLYYASTSEGSWLFLLAYWIFALVVASLIYAFWNRGFTSSLTLVRTESAPHSPIEELPEQLLAS